MKAASNHIILYSDSDFLHKFIEDEFPSLNIIFCPVSNYYKPSKAMQNAILLLDLETKVQVNDQSISKPFLATELTKIISSQLALCQSNFLKIGNFDFSPSQNIATGEGKEIIFTDKEAQLLAYLLRSGDFVNRDELLMQIWGYKNEVETKTLETHIYKLKQKMPILKDLIVRKNLDYRIITPL
jgi:hypothetical protein